MDKKTILITGAGSGLGKGTALGLAKAGHKVIAGVHKWEQRTRLLEEIKDYDYKENIEIIKLDILDVMDCLNAWDYNIDILVSNAGIGQSGPVSEMPVGLIREVMETNVFSALEFAQPFIKQMVDRKNGKVVFVSSVAGLTTSPYLGAYNASKYALEAITQSLRDELTPHNVRIATINPGPYETGFNDRMYESFNQWHNDDQYFTKKKEIIKASKQLLDNQFDPKAMIDLMVDLIPKDTHDFRNILPKELVDKCKTYEASQYDLKCDEKDPSKK